MRTEQRSNHTYEVRVLSEKISSWYTSNKTKDGCTSNKVKGVRMKKNRCTCNNTLCTEVLPYVTYVRGT